MEVRYKREVNHNYMILDAPSEGGGYECRMLASNTIEGLLRFRVRQYEDKREFYYEITSRQPLNRLLEQRKINGGEIRSILLSLSRVLSKIEEYLLKDTPRTGIYIYRSGQVYRFALSFARLFLRFPGSPIRTASVSSGKNQPQGQGRRCHGL